MLEALTTTLKVWDASSVMCYWMKTGSMTFPWRVNLSLQPLGQIKPLLVRCCCCWVSTSFQVSHLILYSSTSSFWGASPEARLKPFAGHAASLATFQRVLTSSQLDPIVWNSHGGGGDQTETEEVRAPEDEWRRTTPPDEQRIPDCSLLQAHPALILSYVENLTHMCTDK